MTRLPSPGGDNGSWGAILNDYLAVAHNSDGSIKDTGIIAAKADKSYVDASVSAGAADSSTSTKGIVKVSTAPITATDPIAIAATDPKVTADQAAGTASIRTLGYGTNQAAQGSLVDTRLQAVESAQLINGGNLGAAYALNLASKKDVVMTGTLTAEVTITVSGLIAGASFKLRLLQDSTGGRFAWLTDGSSNPVLLDVNTVASSISVIDCISPDGTNIDVISDRPPLVAAGSCWGDSLTLQGFVTISTALGLPFGNFGGSGQASSDIAFRQGGLQPIINVAGNSIPASGGVTVTAIYPTTAFRMSDPALYTFNVTLLGIPGVLTHDGPGGVWTFIRTSAGSVTPCPPGTLIIGTDGISRRGDLQIMWIGRNNLTLTTNPNPEAARDLSSMIGWLSSSTPRYFILGIINSVSEWNGAPGGSGFTNNYLNTVACNTALAATYGDRFFDVRGWLVNNALAYMGLTPTAQDTTDIGHDTPPTQLRRGADVLHLTDAAYAAIDKQVAMRLRAKGWA